MPDDVAIAAAFCAESREQRILPDEEASAVICVAAPLSSTSPDELTQSETFLASTDAFISAAEVAFAVNREHLKEPRTFADDDASMLTSSRKERLIITLAAELARIKSLSPLLSIGPIFTLAAERLSMRDSFSLLGILTLTLRLLYDVQLGFLTHTSKMSPLTSHTTHSITLSSA